MFSFKTLVCDQEEVKTICNRPCLKGYGDILAMLALANEAPSGDSKKHRHDSNYHVAPHVKHRECKPVTFEAHHGLKTKSRKRCECT